MLIKEELEISKRMPELDADQPDDNWSRPRNEAAVIQEATGLKLGKRRIWLWVLGIAFIIYIGIVGGYLYYLAL